MGADADEWRRHEHDGWVLELPAGVTGGPVDRLTNPEITTLAIFRGWVGAEAFYAAVTTRPRAHGSLRHEMRSLTAHFLGGPLDGDGRGRSRRADGLMDVEEGYGEAPDWTERVTIFVADRRGELCVLTLRRHPDAPLDDVVDRVVATFNCGERAR